MVGVEHLDGADSGLFDVSKERLQFIVVIAVLLLWTVGLIVSLVDGDTMLRILTPLMTMVFGWLFTQKATAAS
jgi:hypothetical protein